jgi:poly(ADP-ribose) glycohydrolase
VEREVRKLYAAFFGAKCGGATNPVIEAPAWGCHAFDGNLVVKAVCMMIAASLSGVEVRLILTSNREVEIRVLQEILGRGIKASKLWSVLTKSDAQNIKSISELETRFELLC